MFIQETLEVINAFLERYVPYVNEQGDYTQIKTIEDGKIRFTFNNDYYIYAWIKDGELHIETEYGESVFDFAEDYDWSKEDVEYMKYGKRNESK